MHIHMVDVVDMDMDMGLHTAAVCSSALPACSSFSLFLGRDLVRPNPKQPLGMGVSDLSPKTMKS